MDYNTAGATPSATAPSTLVSDDQSKLLGLPVEVVARITSFVSSETLLPVRLTCKALENITFDRFATEKFADVCCWIATVDDFKRLRDILHQSRRLSSRIRQLTLTTDIFRDLPYNAMNYVRRESESDSDARHEANRLARIFDGLSYADAISILRTLQDIRRLPQDILVTADLSAVATGNLDPNGQLSRFGTYKWLPQQCILFALALLRLELYRLSIDRFTLVDSDDLRAVIGAELQATMATLEALNVDLRVHHEHMPVYVDFL